MIIKKSTIKRISKELANEIERVGNQNNLKFVEASREIAKALKSNKKIIREIQF